MAASPIQTAPALSFWDKVSTEVLNLERVVAADFHYLHTEADTLLAWVEKEVPDAKAAISTFLQEAEADAADLAKYSANGMAATVAASVDTAQTTVLNLIQATHLADGAKVDLKAIDLSGGALIKGIAQKAISVGLAQVLAKLVAAAV